MPQLHIRRATVDDLPALAALWAAAGLPGPELEGRLTEFQVVETEGRFAGALGVEIVRQHARIHSEDYAEYGVADAARAGFWERIQTICANHGVFRVWTQKTSPFWTRWGFQPPTPEVRERLPAEWQPLEGRWLTLELKNEEAITQALNQQFSGLLAAEKEETKQVAARAQTFRTFVTVIFFIIGFACFGLAVWMLMHRSLTAR